MRKNGRYWRKKDKRWVQRYYCPNCGKTIISPRLDKPEKPRCRKCGRVMRSHGSYRRKSDGAAVKRYYCPNRRITLQAPIRSKKKRRASKHPPNIPRHDLGLSGSNQAMRQMTIRFSDG